jgi:RHS repeat-associated protein
MRVGLARLYTLSGRAGWRAPAAAALAAVLVANLGGSGVDGLPAASRPGSPHVAASKPDQRWGSAAGQDHLVGRPGNQTVPPSLRSKYPLRTLDGRPQPARNTATVAAPPAAQMRGFDRASSREEPSRRGRFERVYTNVDGTQTTEFSAAPSNYRRADGSWEPIDSRLAPAGGPSGGAGEGWRNRADSVDVRLAGRADDAALASVAFDEAHTLAYALEGAAPVPGQAAGDTVTYRQALAGVDLRLAASPGGVKETLVLHSADAPHSFTFPLRLTGLTARLAGAGASGQVELVDAAGTVRAVIPAGSMVDAAAATSTGVAYQIVASGGGPALRVTVDSAWLRDPGRRYPVEVDPTVSLPVDSGAASHSMYVHGSSTISTASELLAGRVGGADAAAYVKFNGLVSQLQFHTIYGAALQVVNYDAPSCRARPVAVHPVTGAWESATGYPGPAVGAVIASRSFAHGYIATGQSSSACPAAAELFDLGSAGRTLVQRWVNGQQANNGLSLRAPAGDTSAWKRFASATTANPPRLYVTHSPYNASYAIPSPVPNPPVLQNQAGKVKVTVTNLSAEAWSAANYYLAYRAYHANTGAAVTQQRAANLAGTVARGGRVTLEATIKALPPGRYFLDFTMVRSGGVVFTDHQVPPGRIVLEVYDIPPVPQEVYPPNGYQAPTLTPLLFASALDSDAPPGSTLQYKFEVCDSDAAGNRTGCTTSAYQPKTAWTVAGGRLAWSKTYQWRAFVKDATTEVPTPYSTLLTAVPQPEVTSRLAGAPYGTQDREFDAQVGNFSTTAIDATVATVGPELSLIRTYNSLDPRRESLFGAGWSTRFDMKLLPDSDGSGNLVVRYPDGQEVRFGRNPDGTYAAPPGREASLTLEAGSSFKLRDKSATVYQFALLPSNGGPGLLQRITDAASRAIVLTYDPLNNGRLAKAHVANSLTNTNGRSLTFAYTANHVTGVSTTPVGGSALTWTYTYDGDKLTRVCAPDTTCTSYEYGTGSHYRSAVLDSRPESYWRLGEAEGTGAASEVAVNLGKDAGVYRNVTLGAAAPRAEAANTAATFNGTSSYLELPKGTVKKSRDAAVELWFRVNQTGQAGPLLGYQDKAVGTAATAGVPVLYVGTDGRLRGQFATGSVAPLTASMPVNDGRWHHVVLSAMGTTQTLYLNGAKVAEATNAAIEHSALGFNQVGAASATPPGSWANWGTTAQRFFNGDIDEVAVYSHPLGPAAVTAHHRYGANAADQISKVTLPSGRVAAEVAYNVGLDRVSEYTDRNGGTWKIGAPTVYGGDTDLRRGVRVLDPADRSSLYEYDALAGRLLRVGTPLGISTRPEDRPRPSPSPTPTPSPTQVCTTPDPGDPGFCTVIPGNAGGPVFIPIIAQEMAIRSFFYDDRGFQNKVVDENGSTVEMTYDARGNVVSRKTCRSASECHTAHYKYPAPTAQLDPRSDLPTESRDGRSASATDNTYLTSYTYHLTGQVGTQTNPDSSTVRHEYAVGAEAAEGGGNVPVGVLLKTTDARGKVTSYRYFANGDLFRVTEPSGLVTEYAYDALGRKVSEKEVSDSFPSGVTTTYAYDQLGRLSTVTAAITTDAVGGGQHRQQTVNTYDPDGNLTRVTVKDLLGGDPERVTGYEYDEHGRLAVETDAEGNQTRYGYDRFGNQTFLQDANDNRYEFAYTARNMLAEVRLRDWSGDPPGSPAAGEYLVLQSIAYDHAGRKAAETDAMGRRVEYLYYGDDLLRRVTLKGFRNPDATTRDFVLQDNTYDGAGNLVKQVSDNGRTTLQHTVDRAGKVTETSVDPTGLNRRNLFTFDQAGNVTQARRTGNASNVPWAVTVTTEVVDYVYDDAGNMTQEKVSTGSGTLATSYTYDRRGLVTSVTDPRGNVSGADKAAYTTTHRYDELGRRTTTTGPSVQAESGGSAAQPVTPTTVAGYNTFGEAVAVRDPLGNVSRTEFDRLGRPVAATGPAYTPPGPSTALSPTTRTRYDGLGNVVEEQAPGGAVTRYAYDRLNRMVTRDEPASTTDERALTRYTYTRTGELLSATDPTGARVEHTYDDLDRQLTVTQVERRPVADNFTTRLTYDDAGNVVTATSPSGAATTFAYDAVGELIRATDPNGVVSQYGYDYTGRQVRASDGLARTSRVNFDLAGRQTSESDLAPSGTTIRTQSYGYDVAGNLLSATDPAGRTTTYAYDAANQLVSQVEPVSDTKSITTRFGYDAAGNRTRYTDGRNNSTVYTYNSWSLPESVLEPATAAHPAAADRTWTVTYNVDADPVRAAAPGGVARERGYDAAGRLRSETGSGAEAATAARALGYDLAGRLTSAGGNSYAYNDRGALLSASGPSGAASFGYDADGNPTSRTDTAGSATFTYTRGRLATLTDGVTATRQTLGYDAAGEVNRIDYGSGRIRSFGYNDLGLLASDTLANAAGQTVAAISYGFDLNDRLTSKTTTGTAGAGANTYGYDYAGRLTSWTSAAGTVAYEWDDSGNRTRAGPKTGTYDQRNRLLSDGDYTYAYTPRGTLRTRTSSGLAEQHSFDAFDRLTSAEGTTYTYDALDRVVSRNGVAFTYAGHSDEAVSDGAEKYARGPGDELLAVAAGTDKRLALTDAHGDVIAAFNPADTTLPALNNSTAYDPFGKVTAENGDTGRVGYQGDWTDPDTGQVDMGARWYQPGTATFTSRDSVNYRSGNSILANRYTYAGGDPLGFTDPDGHWRLRAPGWLRKAGGAIVRGASTVGGWVSSGYHWLSSHVTSWAKSAWSGFTNFAGKLRDLAASAAKKLSNAVGDLIDKGRDWIDKGKRWIDKGIDWGKQRAAEIRRAAIAKAKAVTAAAKKAVVHAIKHSPLRAVAAAAKPLLHGLAKVVSAAAALPAKVVSEVRDVVKDGAKAVQILYDKTVEAAGDVVQAVSTAAQAVSEFASDHAAAIVGGVAGVVVGLGCGALIGWTGVGAIACGALAGAVGSFVTGYMNGERGMTLAGSTLMGAAFGGITGGLFSVGGAALSGALRGAAGKAAAGELRSIASGRTTGGLLSRSCNSFAASTAVLMADGTRKLISQVQVGDKVLATDPTTGRTAPQKVTDVIAGTGEKQLVEVSVADGSAKPATVTATDEHPFWVESENRWVNAEDLKPGYAFETADHRSATVTGTRTWSQHQRVYNLTVDTTHTYYVLAGEATLLAHNCGVLSNAYHEAKRLINVPRAWLDNRALARSMGGEPPAPNATVRDLTGMTPGNRQRPEKLVHANARSDADLLNSVFNPSDKQFIATNPSMPNTILQGNHRAYQLQLRAADDANKNIMWDTPIFINRGDWR